MVDTKDSKSVASNLVRVKVSSPLSEASCFRKLFLFNQPFVLKFWHQTGAEFVEFYGFCHVFGGDIFAACYVCYGAGYFQAGGDCAG